jgi:Spy/CpxP family protein refolding chaperone
MNKRNVFVVSLVAVLVVAAVPIVYALPGMHRSHGGFGHGLKHLVDAKQELGLSDGQVAEIKGILKDMHQQNATYRAQYHSGLEAIVNTLVEDPSNVAAAQAQLDAQAQTERALKSSLLNAASKALNVLSPDQRRKLATMVAEHRDRKHH